MFKFYSSICLAIFVVMLLCPLIILTPKAETDTEKSTGSEETGKIETVKVMMTASNTVAQVDIIDYLCGSVAAEMPAYYETEALKAQAIACNTYLNMMKRRHESNPDKSLKGAYLSDNSDTHQGYIPIETLKDKWGDKFDEYYSKIKNAVTEVSDKIIVYDNEPIIAAYHALSPGKTESAKNVWGQNIEYLTTVESVGDKLSPDFTETLKFTPEKFKEYANKLDISLGDDVKQWIGNVDKTEVGTVNTIALGNKNVTGLQFRDAFELKSAVFTINYENNCFTITTCGHGHGVGMSQYGADYMARQGSDFNEIIKHYYKGTEIISL